MILNSKSFNSTKQIKEGTSSLNPNLQLLADWVNETYEVNTLNIISDTIQNSNRPRITIIVEYSNDLSKFLGEGVYGYSDKIRNGIIDKFKSIHAGKSIQDLNNFNDVWVIYFAFEPVAIQEVNSKITKTEIEKLKSEINDENLWEILNGYEGPTFFLYTDEQVKKYENNAPPELWTKSYLALIKKHDKFGYLKEEHFKIFLDSKQNFDENYDSNWYYYFK